jgi:tRNA A37 threonylcarbamoyladenosine dehydratase
MGNSHVVLIFAINGMGGFWLGHLAMIQVEKIKIVDSEQVRGSDQLLLPAWLPSFIGHCK